MEHGAQNVHARLGKTGGAAWTYWIVALGFSGGMAAWLGLVFHNTPVVPGGDPGNWVATGYIYLGQPYPSQLTPFGYPPLLFPILGLFVGALGPVEGAQLFAPVLLFMLGISTYALARYLLRTDTMALLAVSVLLIDPSLLDMFYWGAYPNLLAYVFMNLAWIGLLRAGRGHPSSGAFQFWACFAATVLTHSLVGIALSTGTVLFLGLGGLIPTPPRAQAVREAERGELESPSIAARALVQSHGGLVGLLLVLVTVGGYYGGTFALGITHPDYFQSSSGEFTLLPFGTIFQALVPHVYIGRALALDLLAVGVGTGLTVFALLRDRRPRWLTPSALLLLAWLLAPMVLAIVGIFLQIVTDYHRFGFLLLTPVVLTAAYFWETAWVLRKGPTLTATTSEPPTTPSQPAPNRAARGWKAARSIPRTGAMAIVGVAVVLLLTLSATAPAMSRSDAAFTKVGHDAAFLDAVNAIRHSGVRGATLTVAGAEKWTRALTAQNAYAPSSPLYLFYPSQATDAQLAYYALVSHYALTNGKVTAAVHAVNPTDADGLPDYSVSLSGPVHPVLRVVPQSVVVQLSDPGTGRLTDGRLNGTPVVSLPASAGQPMTVVYTETGFTLVVSISVDPVAPTA
ncbi:MAG: hypothetical protein L3K07_00475 [Thermoplasmata archaeon]|nr:hypothetical protein [Thermoplasmata archaeon]